MNFVLVVILIFDFGSTLEQNPTECVLQGAGDCQKYSESEQNDTKTCYEVLSTVELGFSHSSWEQKKCD